MQALFIFTGCSTGYAKYMIAGASTLLTWTIKENVKAKLKVIVKRTLRQYGYPPDMQLLATETILKQAEMIADELAFS